MFYLMILNSYVKLLLKYYDFRFTSKYLIKLLTNNINRDSNNLHLDWEVKILDLCDEVGSKFYVNRLLSFKK